MSVPMKCPPKTCVLEPMYLYVPVCRLKFMSLYIQAGFSETEAFKKAIKTQRSSFRISHLTISPRSRCELPQRACPGALLSAAVSCCQLLSAVLSSFLAFTPLGERQGIKMRAILSAVSFWTAQNPRESPSKISKDKCSSAQLGFNYIHWSQLISMLRWWIIDLNWSVSFANLVHWAVRWRGSRSFERDLHLIQSIKMHQVPCCACCPVSIGRFSSYDLAMTCAHVTLFLVYVERSGHGGLHKSTMIGFAFLLLEWSVQWLRERWENAWNFVEKYSMFWNVS